MSSAALRRAGAAAIAVAALALVALAALRDGAATQASFVQHGRPAHHGGGSAHAHHGGGAPHPPSAVGASAGGAALGASALPTCTSSSPPSCMRERMSVAFHHAVHAGHSSGESLETAPLPHLGLNPLGMPYPPMPLNQFRFACTMDNANPLQDGVYRPCCMGSSPVPDPAQPDGDARICKPDPTEGNPIVECVSVDAVPIPFRCDLTSTEGATSCPFSRMYEQTRYMIYPGGKTSCMYAPTLTGRQPCGAKEAGAAQGQSNRFSFDVRKGDPHRLLVYFQGGGACWSSDSTLCTTISAPQAGGLLDPLIAAHAAHGPASPGATAGPAAGTGAVQPPGALAGAHAGGPPANRYANWTVVQIHYCSGDAHTADVTQSWTSPQWPYLPVRQAGAANVQAVLDWLSAQPEFASLDEFVIAGASAGSLGAQAWARPFLQRLGGKAKATAAIFDSFLGMTGTGRVATGDGADASGRADLVSAGGRILRDAWRVCASELVPSGSARDACTDGRLNASMLLLPVLEDFPGTTFTMVQSKQDLVQRLFYDLTSSSFGLDLPSATYSAEGIDALNSQADLILASYKRAAPRNFFAALIDGNCHTFAGLPDWYQATAEGPGADRTCCPAVKAGVANAGAHSAAGEGGGSAAAAPPPADDELKCLLSSKGGLPCCAHPGRKDIVGGSQLLASLKLADWASLPLVPASQAAPRAKPPLWAAIKDNCYGPLQGDPLADQHPLYACPPLDYVMYGVLGEYSSDSNQHGGGHASNGGGAKPHSSSSGGSSGASAADGAREGHAATGALGGAAAHAQGSNRHSSDNRRERPERQDRPPREPREMREGGGGHGGGGNSHGAAGRAAGSGNAEAEARRAERAERSERLERPERAERSSHVRRRDAEEAEQEAGTTAYEAAGDADDMGPDA